MYKSALGSMYYSYLWLKNWGTGAGIVPELRGQII